MLVISEQFRFARNMQLPSFSPSPLSDEGEGWGEDVLFSITKRIPSPQSSPRSFLAERGRKVTGLLELYAFALV
jgi:hypothetical protein